MLRHWLVAVLAMDLAAVALLGGLPTVELPARAGELARASLAVPGPDDEAGAASRAGARPERIDIPGIAVDAPVVDLGLADDGTLEVPEGRAEAGWWSGGSAPGTPGPTVVVGHVNLRSGPAVFLRLSELEEGDEVEVTRADRARVTYRVTEVRQVDKDAFPTDEVYGPTPDDELRLVTCGGSFRPSDRSYTDNVIVFAERIGRSDPPPAPTVTPLRRI